MAGRHAKHTNKRIAQVTEEQSEIQTKEDQGVKTKEELDGYRGGRGQGLRERVIYTCQVLRARLCHEHVSSLMTSIFCSCSYMLSDTRRKVRGEYILLSFEGNEADNSGQHMRGEK